MHLPPLYQMNVEHFDLLMLSLYWLYGDPTPLEIG